MEGLREWCIFSPNSSKFRQDGQGSNGYRDPRMRKIDRIVGPIVERGSESEEF